MILISHKDLIYTPISYFGDNASVNKSVNIMKENVKIECSLLFIAGIAQSVLHLATGWTSEWSEFESR
jgi:hypothetical protein